MLHVACRPLDSTLRYPAAVINLDILCEIDSLSQKWLIQGNQVLIAVDFDLLSIIAPFFLFVFSTCLFFRNQGSLF